VELGPFEKTGSMQPLYCPELDELMDKRIDVLYSFQLGSGEKAL
jgi:hypothetical protein